MTDTPSKCGVCGTPGRLFTALPPAPEDNRPLLLPSLAGPTPMWLCVVCEASEALTAPQPQE
jgi:hypothetical protein